MAPGSTTTRKKRLSEINQQLAALFSEFRSKVLGGREHLDRARSRGRSRRTARLAGLRGEGCRRRARARGQVGDRQHAIERRSVPDVLDAPRPAREGLEEVQEPRRQRRPERHEGDDRRRSSSCVPNARRCSTSPSHAHWRMSDTMARDPKAAQALMMRVWPAAVARVKEEVADMQAIAAQGRRRRSRSSPGTISSTPRRSQGAVRPRSGAAEAVFRAEQHGRRRAVVRRAALRHPVHGDHRQGAGLPSRRARLRSDRRAVRCAPRPVLPRQLRASRQAVRARGRPATGRSTSSTRGATAISSNNNNFVKACGRRAGR